MITKFKKLFASLLYSYHPLIALKISGAKVGENIFFGNNTYVELENAQFLYIESDAVISAKCNLILHDSSLNNVSGKPVLYGKIILKKNCYIGFGTTILPGSIVGSNTIVGAKSLVKGILKDNSVYIGSPAKYYCSIKELINKQHNKNSNLIKFVKQKKWYKN